jgi:hypothetical protein
MIELATSYKVPLKLSLSSSQLAHHAAACITIKIQCQHRENNYVYLFTFNLIFYSNCKIQQTLAHVYTSNYVPTLNHPVVMSSAKAELITICIGGIRIYARGGGGGGHSYHDDIFSPRTKE